MTKSVISRNGLRNVVLIVSFAVLVAGCGGGGGSSCGGSALLAGLASCGGGGSSASSSGVSTGTFLDSPVAGINYSTQTQSGQTDAKGQFSFLPGENVTFSVGAVKLPPVPANTIITPLDIAQTSDLNNQEAVNIAVFLQTLNQSGDPTRGITISAVAHAAATKQIDFNVSSATFSSNTDLLNLVKNSGSANTSLVSEASAKANLQSTLNGANATPKINIAPVANAGAGQSVTAGSTVTLSGAASSDANGDSVTYSWSFSSKPAGSSVALTNATAINPTFVPDVAGSYVVSLTVNDGSLSSAANTVTITAAAANIPPVANAGSAQSVVVGSTVALSGAGSSAANGSSLTYAWAFVSKPTGSSAALTNATSVNPTFVADVAGSYVVGLAVNDGKVNSPLVTTTITSSTSGSSTQTVTSSSSSPFLESALVTAGNLNPNGFVKSNSGRVFDLRWGTLDAPLSLSTSDNVTLTVQSNSNASLFFTPLNGAVFSSSIADPFRSSALTNLTSLSMQGEWITQPVLNAWATGLDGSKVNVAIIDDFTVNDIAEVGVVTLPNACVNVTAGGTTVLYCSTITAFVFPSTHGQHVTLILGGSGSSAKLEYASFGSYFNLATPTTAAGGLSILQDVTVSRSTPTYGIAFGATTKRDDYIDYQKNTLGLFNQLQIWGMGTDATSVNFQNSKVVNLSIGGTSQNPVKNIQDFTAGLGYANTTTVPDAVFVKAAGNSICRISDTNCDDWNAVFHNATNYKSKTLIVGALTADGGTIAPYSNVAGSFSDRFVVADGRGLLKADGTFDEGTSFAAPRVSGYVAILRQKYPNLTAEDAAAIILSTAKWNTAWGVKNAANQAIYGQGEADLDHALAAIGSLP